MPYNTLSVVLFVCAVSPVVVGQPAPTFSADIAPIVYQNCTTCHREGGGAPFSLVTYEDVQKRAKMIAKVTADKRMPPWLAVRGEVEFHNERGLSSEQIGALAAWDAAGAPMGDAAAIPPAPVFPSEWHNGTPDMLLEMEEEMPVPPDGPDIYRNFVIRVPDIPEGKYLKGIDYKPRALQSAHHTLFSLDTTGDMRRAADSEPRAGFGGMEANLIVGRVGGWAVGAQPDLFPEGVAVKVEPGTDLMLNAHFHPVGKPETEKARVALYLTDVPPTRRMMALEIPYGFGITSNISIPKGEANYVVQDSFTMPLDVELTGLAPHAHLIAKEIKSVATFPDGHTLTLIHVPKWDFAWQEQYHYKQPIKLPKGTRVDMTFVYDNSADNPFNPNSPPKKITWGPNTTDEMACVTLRVVVDTDEQIAQLKQGYGDYVKAALLKTNFRIIDKAVSAQEKERMDLNQDGDISFSESMAGLRRLKGIVAGGHDELGLIPFLANHFLVYKLLPFLAPRLIILALAIAGLVWLIKRRKRRKLAAQASV